MDLFFCFFNREIIVQEKMDHAKYSSQLSFFYSNWENVELLLAAKFSGEKNEKKTSMRVSILKN